MIIRPATAEDAGAIWAVIAPAIAAGETFALPRDMSREAALAYWMGPDRETFVAEQDGAVVGTYYVRPNQMGGGDHVANGGYCTAPHAAGRGVARAMGLHSLDHARARGYWAMQFNFVIASNERAVGLWRSLGFRELTRLPKVFRHPTQGAVDALVMFQAL